MKFGRVAPIWAPMLVRLGLCALLLSASCATPGAQRAKASLATPEAESATAPVAAVERAVATPDGPSVDASAVPQTASTTARAQASAGEPPAALPIGLPRLYRALHDLQLGRRQEHVRITFFGDSHVAADFYTGRLRQLLQARFGNGGPGFVPIGVPSVRHEQVLSQVSGKWQREPVSPASYQTQGDGRYGLSGMRAVAPTTAAEAQVKFHLGALAALPSDTITWELVYRLNSPLSHFSLQIGSEKSRRVALSGQLGHSHLEPGIRVRDSQLFGLRFDAPKDARIRVTTTADKPELFGIIGETARAGLVLDALGINGARARTILGWHAGTWQGELAEREPLLVVLAYGTNEVGDGTQLQSYRGFYQQILERVRGASPEAECLLIGPTERVDANFTVLTRAEQLDLAQRQIAEELGCAYHSWLSLIAESGGLRAWTQGSPQLAANDRIHLTRAGYQRLAEELFAQLMSSYSQIYGGPLGPAVGSPPPGAAGITPTP